MLKNILGKKKSPEIVGGHPAKNSTPVLRKYYLEFPTLEGEPTFLLEDSLTVGSEDGDVLLQNEGIGPNHFSLILNQDVLSIVDHGSPEGTFVNKRRIPSGKMIILSPKDKLKAGAIPFQVVEREEEVAQAPVAGPDEEVSERGDEAPPSLPSLGELVPEEETLEEEAAVENAAIEEADSEDKTLVDDVAEIEPVEEGNKKKKKKKKNGARLSLIGGAGTKQGAANGFLRALGLICDALLVGLIHNLASNELAYRQFLKELPEMAMGFIRPLYEKFLADHIDKLLAQVPALGKAWEFAMEFYKEEYIVIVQLGLLLVIFRFVTPLIFGATLGQCLVGIRGGGSFLLKRVLSPARAAFGAVLLPLFWIFDFPTLFSKRSLKEVLSFTRLETPSSILAIISSIFFIPLFLAALFTGPVWQDMSLPKPIPFSPMKEVELGVFDTAVIDSYSNYFRVGIPGGKADYFLPLFKFSQKAGRKNLEPSFVLGKEEDLRFELKLLKNVSLVKFFAPFARSNPLTELKYPEIGKLVHDVSNTSKNFKDRDYPEVELASDVQRLMKWSLGLVELEPENMIAFLKDNGPFIGAFMNFRSELLGYMGGAANGFQMKQLGNSLHIIGDYSNARKTIWRFMPLNSKQTGLYEISFQKGMDPALIELMAWNLTDFGVDSDPLVAFVDVLGPKGERKNIQDIFQAVSQAYFELGKASLTGAGGKTLYQDVTRSIQGSLAVLENSQDLGLPEKPSNKLTQNLNDILKALKDKDLRYFGISAVGAI